MIQPIKVLCVPTSLYNYFIILSLFKNGGAGPSNMTQGTLIHGIRNTGDRIINLNCSSNEFGSSFCSSIFRLVGCSSPGFSVITQILQLSTTFYLFGLRIYGAYPILGHSFPVLPTTYPSNNDFHKLSRRSM